MNKRVGVLMGGLSSERDVSLQSGKGIHEALCSRGMDAIAIDWAPGANLPQLLQESRVEVVWIALHGTFGEDGAVQGLLECLQIPYTGSGIAASAMAMDKVISKRIFAASEIPTAPWQLLGRSAHAADVAFELPVVIKPTLEGSSVGVSIVKSAEQLAPAIAEARKHRGEVMVEKFISGAETCTGILDDKVLASVEIVPATEFYDYDAKYLRDDTQYVVPPAIDPNVLARVEAAALRAHRALGCRGYSRVDTLVTEGGELSVLEVNTLPGMTSHSLLPKAAMHCGIDFAELCVRVLASASC